MINVGNEKIMGLNRSRDVSRANLFFERLEMRQLFANLWLTDIYLNDSKGNRISAADEGEYVNISMSFRTLALPAGSSYVVRRTINGMSNDVTLNWGNGNAGQGNWFAGWGLGNVVAGINTIQVTLDVANTISETSETDNSMTIQFVAIDVQDPKFLNPLGGVPNQDWAIGNRVDLDPGPGVRDYRGNPYSYNGHDALDIGLAASWQQQASGTPIYASAAGVVASYSDGGDDKCGHPTVNECGADNGVSINHGGGWRTWYNHMRKGSVAVRTGNFVAAGQFLGFVGSSGNSSGPHLHWAVYHNGVVVETYLRPNELLADPVPYIGEDPGIMDMYSTGVSKYENREERDVFLTTESPAVWIVTQGIIPGVRHDIIWYTPSGIEFYRDSRTTGSFQVMVLVRTLSGEQGVWTVVTEVKGVKKGETKFLKTANMKPEVKVTALANNFTQVLDETSVPVRFDPTETGRIGSTRTLTVRNVGNSQLSTSGLTIPTGFILVEGLSSVIEPGKEDTFTIQLNTTVAGLNSGVVSFTTNDADESTFTFPVEGLVLSLNLTLSASTVQEGSMRGATTGTVTRPSFGLSQPMVVYLSSNDRSEATVPLRVTIPAGQTVTSFPLDAVEDKLLDGNKIVTITASLIGNVSTTANITVIDAEKLSLVVAPTSAVESAGNGAFSATVTRSNTGNLNALTVNLSSSDVNAATVQATITIPAGAFSAAFHISPVNDSIADGDQVSTITASANEFVSGSTKLTVVDDETATLTMNLTTNSISENRGLTTGTVTRNTPTNTSQIVNLVSSDTTAATVPGSVIIPVGEFSATFLINGVDDAIADGTQVSTITASAANFQAGATQLNVLDDEVATLRISLTNSVVQENSGSTTATVTRNTPTNVALTVNLASSLPGVASVLNSVTIPVGETSATFTVTLIDDTIANGNRQATVSASATNFVTGAATVTIVDNESPSLSLTVSRDSISEDGGTSTITVTRNTPTAQSLVVTLRSSDTTAATVPNSVTIPAGANSITFLATATNDSIADGNQQVTITASATGFSNGTVPIVVVDDEIPTLGVSLSPISVSEKNGKSRATVTRNTPTTSSLIVNLSSSDLSAATVPSSVVIPVGASFVSFDVIAVDDSIVDGSQVANISAIASDFVPGVAQLTVTDDDIARLTLSTAVTSISEKDGTTTAVVTRNTSVVLAMSIDIISSDPLSVVVPKTVTIPIGAESTTFLLTAIDDAIADGNQLVTITTAANGMISGTSDVNVIDDEFASLMLRVDKSSIAERDGQATAIVTRNTPVTNSLEVIIASVDASKVQVPLIVTIPAGQASVSFDVLSIDNTKVDGDQEVMLSASSLGFAIGQGKITILDDDVPTLQIVVSNTSISEKDGVTTGIVTRNTSTTSTLTVGLTNTRSSLVDIPTTVVIPIGAVSVSFSIKAINDAFADGDDSLELSAAASGFQSSSGTLNIIEDDVPSLFIELAATSIFEPNGTTTAKVKRNTPTTNALIVSLASSDTGEAVVPETVMIPAGASEASFTITAMADNVVDGPQKAQVTASFVGFVAGLAEITIVDVDVWTWTNQRNPLDTDDDNTVSPLDVLSLINDLNSNGSRRLKPPLIKPRVFLDPDRDGFVSPLDVLVIVNYLNRANSGGEGEAVSAPLRDRSVNAVMAFDIDQYFSHWSSDELSMVRRRRQSNSRS